MTFRQIFTLFRGWKKLNDPNRAKGSKNDSTPEAEKERIAKEFEAAGINVRHSEVPSKSRIVH
jgi:hypothetical protein